MRILQIHNTYRQSGGEDNVVVSEAKLLHDYGNDVRLFGADNKSISGIWSQLRTGLRTKYNVSIRCHLEGELAKWRPDVVHVHNFFPILSPSVFDACLAFNVPTIMTLHNFRLFCPGALLFRNARVCEDCVGKIPWRGVLYRCYRRSLLGSLAAAHMVAYHQRRQTWQRKVGRFIVMSEFARNKFVNAGWKSEHISIKPHFYSPPPQLVTSGKRRGALFAGRLSSEKGVMTLLAAWKSIPHSLMFAGDGPLRKNIENGANCQTQWLGWLTKEELSTEMCKALCLIVPSECYETFGMVVIEAFAHGLPVVAARIGALTELITEGENGLLFEPGNTDDLALKARWILDHPDEAARMGENARSLFAIKFTPEINYSQLLKIYQRVISEKMSDSHSTP